MVVKCRSSELQIAKTLRWRGGCLRGSGADQLKACSREELVYSIAQAPRPCSEDLFKTWNLDLRTRQLEPSAVNVNHKTGELATTSRRVFSAAFGRQGRLERCNP